MEPYPVQLAAELRRRIAAGTYRPGQMLPSYRQLADETGFALSTVRAALNILKSEGLVVGQPGKGVFVSNAQPTDLRSELAALRADLARLNERLSALEALIRGRSTRP